MTPQPDDAPIADRFRVLFEHSSDAHFIFDETGITDCNAATIELLKATDKSQVLALHPAVLSPEYQPTGACGNKVAVAECDRGSSQDFRRIEQCYT